MFKKQHKDAARTDVVEDREKMAASLQKRLWIFRYHKMQGIYWLAEQLTASQRGLWSMDQCYCRSLSFTIDLWQLLPISVATISSMAPLLGPSSQHQSQPPCWHLLVVPGTRSSTVTPAAWHSTGTVGGSWLFHLAIVITVWKLELYSKLLSPFPKHHGSKSRLTHKHHR